LTVKAIRSPSWLQPPQLWIASGMAAEVQFFAAVAGETEQLSVLVAAVIHTEDEFVARRREIGEPDRLLVKGELFRPGSWGIQTPGLWDAVRVHNARELSIGTERRLARASDIEIPLDVVGRRSRGRPYRTNRRNCKNR
jgi:hypothetical protein